MSLQTCTLPDGHRTGTPRAYDTGCRCPDSREARRVYQAQRYRQRAYGRLHSARRVDGGPARARLEELAAQGVNLRRMAAELGYSKTTFDRLRNLHHRQVLSTTAEAILAYEPTPTARLAGARVHAIGAIRRVRALTALGWTCSMIAAHGDVSPAAVQLIRAGKPEQVRERTHHAICQVYDLLWDRNPDPQTMQERAGVTRARNLAAHHGWLLPMAWDDHGLDDPDYAPDVAVLRPAGGTVRAALDSFIDLLDLGVAPGEAATRAGYTQLDTALTALRRSGRSITEWTGATAA